MSKLSLEALKERAEVTASIELLESISGGTENSCHDTVVGVKELEANLQGWQTVMDFISIFQH